MDREDGGWRDVAGEFQRQVAGVYGQGRGGGAVGVDRETTAWTLDQRGLPTSMTDPDGNTTSYTYDAAGQLTTTTGPVVSTQGYGSAPLAVAPVTQTGYDTFGEATETRDPDGE